MFMALLAPDYPRSLHSIPFSQQPVGQAACAILFVFTAGKTEAQRGSH